MRLRLVRALVIALQLGAGSAALSAPARTPAVVPAAAAASREYVDGKLDVGQYLPDNALLGRVGTRDIRVFDFRDGYFASAREVRPGTDSLGRYEFLQSIVKKDILGQTALAAGYTLSFEDRTAMGGYRASVLSNMLYMRTVRDSSNITEDSLKVVHQFYGHQLKIQLLYFPKREIAELTRMQLLRGTLPWSAAFARHAADLGNGRRGEIDSLRFGALPIELALQIWSVQPGKISPILSSATGYHIVRVVDRRQISIPDFHSMRSVIRLTLLGVESDARRRAIQTVAKQNMGVVYDSTNIRWASSRFSNPVSTNAHNLTTTIEVEEGLPEFESPDLRRVLIRWKGSELTLGTLLQKYSDVAPINRPNLSSMERMMDYADALMLEPRMVEIAEERGLGRDSTALALIARRQEEILVTRMVEDSVFSKIDVTEPKMRQYYADHLRDFLTFSLARFAIIVRPTRESADSVKRQLDQKVPASRIVAADSLAGNVRSGISETRRDVGVEFRKLLFEEMRPGQSQVFGPDRTKSFAVIQLIEIVPERQLSYAESAPYIQESLRNLQQDEGLEALLARLRGRFKIELHPELLMRVRLTDPTVDGL